MGNLRQSLHPDEWEELERESLADWRVTQGPQSVRPAMMPTPPLHPEQGTNYLNVIDTLERPQDNVTWEVINDLTQRAKVGFKKYGTTLESNNHQNMIQHAYEEALDLAQYLKKEITTRQTIQQLVYDYPNDQMLGEQIRRIFSSKP
jgi:hypothetical protein